MGIFIAGRTSCFICAQPIVRRVDASQLSYVWPSDLGDDAKRGRPFVHRACWTTWPKRALWTDSSTRVAANAPDARTFRAGAVVITRTGSGGALLQDMRNCVRMLMCPREAALLLSALRTEVLTTIRIDGSSWTISPDGPARRIQAAQGGERYEAAVLDNVDDWQAVLDAFTRAASPPDT